MALICTTATTWIIREILNPVDQWVQQQEQRCKRKKWWNPASWFCWLITITVKVVTWITRNILVPIINVICNIITGIIGGLMLPFAAAIDAACSTCNTSNWVKRWWITRTKITFINKIDSPTRPGFSDYNFTCNCNNNRTPITVTADSDSLAQSLAIENCNTICP